LKPLLVHTNLLFGTAAVSCKALRKGFLKWCLQFALPKLLVLSKNQQELISNDLTVLNQNRILFSFLFENGMTDRVPVKGNCVGIGPSLVAETLS